MERFDRFDLSTIQFICPALAPSLYLKSSFILIPLSNDSHLRTCPNSLHVCAFDLILFYFLSNFIRFAWALAKIYETETYVLKVKG